MPSWVRTRYGCNNPTCSYALDDRIFSPAEHARSAGLCRTRDGQGCGQALLEGGSVNLLPRWIWRGFLALTVLLATALLLQRIYFPAPLQHIHFATTQSESIDDDSRVEIEIVRDDDMATAVSVDYAMADGSAKAGDDYAGNRGRLVFAAGERSALISIELLRDSSHQKPRRFFSVTLSNVSGKPSHRIYLTARPATQAESAFMDGTVLAMSRVAKEIADNVVRQGVLDQLLADSRNNPGEFAAYRRSLAAVNGDLNRARERYVQDLQSLKAYQPASVLEAMDRTVADLQRQGFAQQAQATQIMKRHFSELLNQAKADMDRWAKELSAVVPRTDPDDDSTTI